MQPGTKVGSVYIDIEGDNSGFKKELRETQSASRRTGRAIENDFRKSGKAVEGMDRQVNQMRSSMLALAAATGLAFGGSSVVRTWAEFGQAMSTVKAVTGATEAQFKMLEAQAKSLGSTTRFSASQAAEGMIDLARAGLSVEEVMLALPAALNLAQAGNLSIADSADIATNVLAGMGLEIEKLPHVMDLLTVAANNANTDVQQLGAAMSYGAPFANMFGLSIEETAAAMAIFSNNGIKADRAGTALNNVLSKLSQRTDKGQKILEKYGLTYDDLSVSVHGFTEVLKTLEGADINADDLVALFSIRGSLGGSLLSEQRDDLLALLDTFEDVSGEAERVAGIMDDNLMGALKNTASAFERLVLEMGALGSESLVRDALEGIASLLRLAAANADVLAAAMVALSARAIIPLIASVGTGLTAALTKAKAELVALEAISGRAIGTAGRLRIALSTMGGPVTLAISAAAGAMVYFAASSQDASDRINNVNESLGKLDQVQKDIAKDVSALLEKQEALATAIESQGTAAQATAALEVQALQKRINKNRELAQVYEAQARSELVSATKQIGNLEDAISRRGRATAITDDQGLGRVYSDPDKIMGALARKMERDGADSLNGSQERLLKDIARLRELEVQADAAREAIDALNAAPQNDRLGGDLRDLMDPPEGGGAAQGTSQNTREAGSGSSSRRTRSILDQGDAVNEAAQRLALQKQLRSELELEYEIDLARAELRAAENSGVESLIVKSEERLTALEDERETIAMTQELMRAGLTSEEARTLAAQRVLELRQAETQELRSQSGLLGGMVAGAAGQVGQSAKAIKEGPNEDIERIKQDMSRAFTEAIKTGDFGEAFESVVYGAVNRGLENAITEGVDLLFDALGDIDWGGIFGGGGGGGSIFGSIAGAFGFGGGKASGGSVGGMRSYLVGEKGPELFVPGADGFIIPNQPKPNVSGSGLSGGQSISVRGGDVIVQGDASEKTLALIRQSQEGFARELPQIIRREVSDGQKRGRYL